MIGPIFDAKGSADLALRKEEQAMDEFFGIYGFYCDSDLQIRNRASTPSKARYRNTTARSESSSAIC